MKSSKAFVLCYFLALSICMETVLTARILFLFPLPYFTSHYRFCRTLVEELAARGHQITAYTGFKQEKPIPNYKAVHVPLNNSAIKMKDSSVSSRWPVSHINHLWTFFPTIAEVTLQGPELQELMSQPNDSYDLLIVEALFTTEYLLAFGHKFGVPVVNLHPLMMSPLISKLTGAPNDMSYIPDYRYPHTDQMSFWQRVTNTAIGAYELIGGHVFYLPKQDSLMRRNFRYPGSENLPHVSDLIADISLHLINANPLFTYSRPLPPNIIDVAGMNLKRLGKLPQDLQTFLDGATDGAIFFSFGSRVSPSVFSPETKKVFVETMKNLTQYRIIWKWTEAIDDVPDHILQRNWLPQPEILAHPNCKLFITHGGFNSLVEVMSIGKPVLGLPFFADQFFNLAFYEQAGVGLEASLNSITVADFTEKIHRIIQTPSFLENAMTFAARFHDQSQSSLEKAVHWVEYVIKHKGAHHLKPASLKLPFYKYLLIDVILFYLLSIFLTFYTFLWTIRNLTCQFHFVSYNNQKCVNDDKKQK